jgi:hypothetical protein
VATITPEWVATIIPERVATIVRNMQVLAIIPKTMAPHWLEEAGEES